VSFYLWKVSTVGKYGGVGVVLLIYELVMGLFNAIVRNDATDGRRMMISPSVVPSNLNENLHPEYIQSAVTGHRIRMVWGSNGFAFL
jgi:hypothetical protein